MAGQTGRFGGTDAAQHQVSTGQSLRYACLFLFTPVGGYRGLSRRRRCALDARAGSYAQWFESTHALSASGATESY